MPIAVRYTQDAFSRSGWLWPVDAKGKPLKASSYMAVGFYVAKNVNKKSDMDLAAKGLGAKEWNNSLKTKLSLLPKKLFRIRMSRNFGMKMLTMTNLSTECLIQLTKSNQIKQLIRNGRSASMQRTFNKSFTSFSHSTRNKTRDGLIRVRNIRALNGRFNTSITHAYSIVIGSKHITLNATGGGFLNASNQFRHGATSKSRSNTASNSTKHKSPHLSGCRQIISLIT